MTSSQPSPAAAPAAPRWKGSFGGDAVAHLKAKLDEVLRNAGPGREQRVLILTHRSPDPDALGACEGLSLLLRETFGLDIEIATVGRIQRAENMAMVRMLELDLEDFNEIEARRFAACCLVDSQPEFGHTVVPDDIPIVAVFDHHVPPKVDGKGSLRSIPHCDVRLGIGSTSAILYEYLRDAGQELDVKTASALFCGVRYDTADLSRNASPLDEEAYYEMFRQADRTLLARIAHPPLPRDYYKDLTKALSVARQHGPLVIAFLGKVLNPEFVAEMADFFLRMKGVSWVVVGGAHEGSYILSLRTDYAFGNAYPLMARLLGKKGSFGGHGHIAGGRISLDDDGESTVSSVERELRAAALDILGAAEEAGDSLPPEGRSLG